MTGRDLIIYILENNLEEASIASAEEAAVRFYSGPATIKALVEMNKLNGLKIGDNYIVFIKERDE